MFPETAIQDILLDPGQVAFGEGWTRIRTLLGSCVAITFWNPERSFGAMCHYLLSKKPENQNGPLDPRFAGDAFTLLLERFQTLGIPPSGFQVKLFGGGDMFPTHGKRETIGEANILAGRHLLQAAGFKILIEDVGRCMERTVILELWSGDAWVRPGPPRCKPICLKQPGKGCPIQRLPLSKPS